MVPSAQRAGGPAPVSWAVCACGPAIAARAQRARWLRAADAAHRATATGAHGVGVLVDGLSARSRQARQSACYPRAEMREACVVACGAREQHAAPDPGSRPRGRDPRRVRATPGALTTDELRSLHEAARQRVDNIMRAHGDPEGQMVAAEMGLLDDKDRRLSATDARARLWRKFYYKELGGALFRARRPDDAHRCCCAASRSCDTYRSSRTLGVAASRARAARDGGRGRAARRARRVRLRGAAASRLCPQPDDPRPPGPWTSRSSSRGAVLLDMAILTSIGAAAGPEGGGGGERVVVVREAAAAAAAAAAASSTTSPAIARGGGRLLLIHGGRRDARHCAPARGSPSSSAGRAARSGTTRARWSWARPSSRACGRTTSAHCGPTTSGCASTSAWTSRARARGNCAWATRCASGGRAKPSSTTRSSGVAPARRRPRRGEGPLAAGGPGGRRRALARRPHRRCLAPAIPPHQRRGLIGGERETA